MVGEKGVLPSPGFDFGEDASTGKKMLRLKVQKLEADVEDLSGEVVELKKKLNQETLGGPWHWESLTPSRKADLLEKVESFVRFMNKTYLEGNASLRLKPCWYRHPDVLWQVTAIYSGFLYVYNRGQIRASMGHADFHTRVLWPLLERISYNQSMKECSPKKCRAMEPSEADDSAQAEAREKQEKDFRDVLDQLRTEGNEDAFSDDDPWDASRLDRMR